MTDTPVYADFRKWPDSPHWYYLLYPLGDDAHGRWFCKPAQALIQRRPDPPYRYPQQSVVLIPDDAWWAASWNSPGGKYQLYVDIASPARWDGDSVTMHDLDLDVVRDWQGRTQLLDEDEFAEHTRTRGYPREIIDGARRSADAVLEAVEQRREPFDAVGARWLAAAGARTWPTDDAWIERRAASGR